MERFARGARSGGRDDLSVTRVEDLPDMVFTANAALIHGERAVMAIFAIPSGKGKSPMTKLGCSAPGFRSEHVPADLHFEGAGDALFCGDTLFAGYRIRSAGPRASADRRDAGLPSDSARAGRPVLLPPRHLLLPAGGRRGGLFSTGIRQYGRDALKAHIPRLIEASEDEARHFACNAVVVGRPCHERRQPEAARPNLRAAGSSRARRRWGNSSKPAGARSV